MSKFAQPAAKSGSLVCVSSHPSSIASTTLKADVLSTMELGMILPVGGYECQLISLLNESETLEESRASHLPKGSPKSTKNTLNRVLANT